MATRAVSFLTAALLPLGHICAQSVSTQEPTPAARRATSPDARREFIAIQEDLRAGRFPQAQQRAEQLVRYHPSMAAAWIYLGIANVRLNRPEEAIRAFEKAIKLDERLPHAYLNLALLYASRNDTPKALQHYAQGLALDPRNAAGFYNYGLLLLQDGRLPEAVHALRRAVELNSGDVEARLALVRALLRSGRRADVVDHIYFLKSNSSSDLVKLVGLLLEAGELGVAREVLQQILRVFPRLEAAHVQFAKLQSALGDYEGALRYANRAVELSPDSLEANLVVAEILIAAGRDADALEILSRISPRFKGLAGFHYTLGITLSRNNRRLEAIEEFRKAVQLDPTFDVARFLLGTNYFMAGELEKAEAEYKEAIALNPRDPIYYTYLARVYERKGPRFQEAAVQTAQRALALNPEVRESKVLIARWEETNGNLEGARRLLEEVVSQDSESTQARVLLGRVYYRLGMREKGDEQRTIIRALEEKKQEELTAKRSQ